MKTKIPLIVVSSFFILHSAFAATTINSANKYAYGANTGWQDWRGDTANGVVIGAFVCSGSIYDANLGWISLGGGTPTNGIRYVNVAPNDFGVNHDGLGNLRGFAYGANIGWVNFESNGAARVDLVTGKLSGSAYSANCGWISLSNAFAFVQTDTIAPGADTDGDGIPDAWELLHFGNLTMANASSDKDGDGKTDKEEYLADTDPLNPNDNLRITSIAAAANSGSATLTWTSEPSRLYRVKELFNLVSGTYTNASLGLFTPDAGATTTRAVAGGVTNQHFYKVDAVLPLAP